MKSHFSLESGFFMRLAIKKRMAGSMEITKYAIVPPEEMIRKKNTKAVTIITMEPLFSFQNGIM